jgi:hypothetical protein
MQRILAGALLMLAVAVHADDTVTNVLTLTGQSLPHVEFIDTRDNSHGRITFSHGGLNAGHTLMGWGPNGGFNLAGPFAINNFYHGPQWIQEGNWVDQGDPANETYWTNERGLRVFHLGIHFNAGTAAGAMRGGFFIDGTNPGMRNAAQTNILDIYDNQSRFTGVQIRNTNGGSHGVRLELGGTDRDHGGWHIGNSPASDLSERFFIWNNFSGGYPLLIDRASNTVGIGHGYNDALSGGGLDVLGNGKFSGALQGGTYKAGDGTPGATTNIGGMQFKNGLYTGGAANGSAALGTVSGEIIMMDPNYPAPAGFTKLGTTLLSTGGGQSISVNLYRKN